MSEGTVELCKLERRQSGHKMSQLSLEHQSEEVAAHRTGSWQAVFRTQLDFGREAEDFSIDRSKDYRRYIFMFGNKGTGDDNVITRFGAALGHPLAATIDFSSPHELACSAISARAWRASRLRCFRKMAPSLASVARRRSASAYCRSAMRTSAVRLRRRDDFSVSSSSSFAVASSMAIVFMRKIISAMSARAQVLCCLARVRTLTGMSS